MANWFCNLKLSHFEIIVKGRSVFVIKLKEFRLKKGITQQDLAELLKLRCNTVSQYETGKRRLTAEVIIRICLVLETTPNELLDFSNAYEKYTDELIRMRSEYEKEKII